MAWIRYAAFTPPELEVAPCDDLIDQIHRRGWIEPSDGDMPQPRSEDSYNYFLRNNYWRLSTTPEQLRAHDVRWALLAAAREAKRREKWQEEIRRELAARDERQRQRQIAREEIAAREWEAAEYQRAWAARREQERAAYIAEHNVCASFRPADKYGFVCALCGHDREYHPLRTLSGQLVRPPA